MWKSTRYVFFLFSLVQTFSVLGQTNERIQYKADELFEFRKKGEKIRKLIGNVVFKQKSSTMYCDSSFFYVKDNIMEAYGHVKIIDDSVTITSRRLIYNGSDRTAKLRENVIYTKGEQRLTTNFLDYNMETEVGNYFNSGTLKDSTNTLKSQIGYFYGKANYALFWDRVILTAPDYVLSTDTLRYNSITKVANTTGKTEIETEDGSVLHARGGEFRTVNDQSQFVEGNVETTDYYLEGDELFFDDLKKYYDATGNVKLTAKDEDIIIIGDEGFADKINGISKIYGHALMKRVLEQDTFYLAADTLVSIESEYDSLKRILAYNNVKMWRFNLQGIADSASYFLSDSLIYLYDDPVFWNLENQIEGDTIFMEITEDQIRSMTLLQNAFLTSTDTIANFNQIKGRTMKAHFGDSEIKKIDVNGNGEAIYYVLDDSDSLNIVTMGMNRILCSDMTIRFKNQELNNITFFKKPEARFIPPHELTEEVQKLRGFNWRKEEKPSLEEVTYQTISIENPPEPEAPRLPLPEVINKEGLPVDEQEMLKNLKSEND
ncbi:MAG: OstA-like protein [Bacteroidota bacterium]